MEAVGINGAASTGDAIANGRTGEALLGAAFLAVPGGEGAGGAVRTEARNLAEQLTMSEAKAGAGTQIMQGKIKDATRAGWAKMQHVHTNPDGTNIVIHYWQEIKTGVTEGFKFKNP